MRPKGLRSGLYAPNLPPYYATICKILYNISSKLMSFQFDFNFL